MKVLVFPHRLEIAGSQINAIDLAVAARDHGHDMVFFATPGPAAALVEDLGFRLLVAPCPKGSPSPPVIAALRETIRAERPDLVHAYDWPQTLDAFFGAYMANRTPMLASIMSMGVPRFLPRTIPLTFGTAALAEQAARRQRAPVTLLEPPVDTEAHRPGAVDPTPFIQEQSLDPSVQTIVSVSRLTSWLKQEGLERAIDAMAELRTPAQLVIVGDGPAAARLRARANETNRRLGRCAVVLTGPMLDPRPAYAAADVVIGMGGSILRGMAFAKPAVVLGEEGFSLPFDHDTASLFLRDGFYGLGEEPSRPVLAEQLEALLGDTERAARLGAFARHVVVERYGLAAAAERLDRAYEAACEGRPAEGRGAAEGARVLALRTGARVRSAGRSWRAAHRSSTNEHVVTNEPRPVTQPLVPLVDLAAQHAEVAAEIDSGFARVVERSAFISGEEVSEFEHDFARYCETTECVGVANGTDALEIMFRSVGIGPGDEVIVPVNTFVASAAAVARTGARPVFVDVDPEFLLLDPDRVATRSSARTRAILAVHLFGQMAPTERLQDLALVHEAVVLEDMAQAHGATRDGRRAGSAGIAAAVSFYPGKNLGAYGDAGAVLTSVPAVAERARGLGNHGSVMRYEHREVGQNSRLDTLQAVVLSAKLRRLDAWNDARRRAADRYAALLRDLPEVRLPAVAAGNAHVWHLFVVRVPDRDRIVARMHEAGIQVGIHYPVPLHLQEAFADLGYRRGEFPVAEAAAREILSLPLSPHITSEQQERVAGALAAALP